MVRGTPMEDLFRNAVEKCIYLADNKQTVLAKKLKTTQQTISRWKENRFIPPSKWALVLRVFEDQITQDELSRDYMKIMDKNYSKDRVIGNG